MALFNLYLINSYIFIITQSINKYINIIYKLKGRGQYLPCIKGRIEKECTRDVLKKIQSGPNLTKVYLCYFSFLSFFANMSTAIPSRISSGELL